jgi:hypothetical protein
MRSTWSWRNLNSDRQARYGDVITWCVHKSMESRSGALARMVSMNKYAALRIHVHKLIGDDEVDNETSGQNVHPHHPGSLPSHNEHREFTSMSSP